MTSEEYIEAVRLRVSSTDPKWSPTMRLVLTDPEVSYCQRNHRIGYSVGMTVAKIKAVRQARGENHD